MDEFNRNLPGERANNVQFLDYPTYVEEDDTALFNEYDKVIALRKDVLKALEEARNNKVIGSSQEAMVNFEITDKETMDLVNLFTKEEFANLFVVSEVDYEKVDNMTQYEVSKVNVSRHTGEKCSRCWNYSKKALIQEDGTYLCPRCQKVIHK